jgi:tRNA 2-thiouridine synthesizing protein E
MTAEYPQVSRDEEGYLINPEDWNEELARRFALEEKLELTNECWIVINFMRDYYADQRIAADIRHVAKHLANELGCDKKTARNRIFVLFPHGHVKQVCKIAGMRRPRAWSTG